MSDLISEQDAQVVQYLHDYWKLHPQAWDELNDAQDTQAWRGQVWRQVNAATEGHLQGLVDADSLHWIFLFGLGVAFYERHHP